MGDWSRRPPPIKTAGGLQGGFWGCWPRQKTRGRMHEDGNSLDADVGYWHKTHLLRSPETHPTLKSV